MQRTRRTSKKIAASGWDIRAEVFQSPPPEVPPITEVIRVERREGKRRHHAVEPRILLVESAPQRLELGVEREYGRFGHAPALRSCAIQQAASFIDRQACRLVHHHKQPRDA